MLSFLSYRQKVKAAEPADSQATNLSNLETVRCNLCGGHRTRPLCQKYGLHVVVCKDCGLTFVNPRLIEAEALRRYSPTYFAREYQPLQDRNWQSISQHYRNVLQSVKALAPTVQPFRLLELGCGSGGLLHLAHKELGWEVSGVEYNPEAVRYAHQHYHLKSVVQCNLYGIHFPPSSFEAIVLADVIEHVYDPKRLVSNIQQWLTPGGILFISTPNIDSEGFHKQGADWAQIGPGEHVYYFSSKTLTELLKQCRVPLVRLEYNTEDRDAIFAYAQKAA
jgi:2-polyprenyl-3-methyl-5-hydroxy-6-metoxy-1,4-benzoquinol methylase